jgi:hypothetical protein
MTHGKLKAFYSYGIGKLVDHWTKHIDKQGNYKEK